MNILSIAENFHFDTITKHWCNPQEPVISWSALISFVARLLLGREGKHQALLLVGGGQNKPRISAYLPRSGR